jgi:hypothetical protein
VYLLPTGLTLAASETVTLDNGGMNDARFEFIVPGPLVTGAGSRIKVVGTGMSSKVRWTVSGRVHLGAASVWVGDITTEEALDTGDETVVNGRIVAKGAVTLGANSPVLGDVWSKEGAITTGAGASVSGSLKTTPGVGAITTGAASTIKSARAGGAITIGAGSTITGVTTAAPRSIIAKAAVTIGAGTHINGGKDEIVAGAATTIGAGVYDINENLIV